MAIAPLPDSIQFSGHETFPLRQLWLRKAYEAAKRAKQALLIENEDEIWKAFGSRKPWLVVPVVGRRQTIEEAIGQAIDKHAPQRGPKRLRNGRRDVVAELIRRAESNEHGGVLLVLDEMGKLLEAAAAAGEDIYVFQELAEAASRSGGKLVVVGVLHQAFDQYATRSGRSVQSEWAKVQGRFVDVPVPATCVRPFRVREAFLPPT